MIISRTNKYFSKNRYRLLLVFILGFLILPSFFPDSLLGKLILLFFLSFVLIQSIYAFTENRLKRRIILFFALLILLLSWYTGLRDSPPIYAQYAQLFFTSVFFGFVMLAFFKIIFKTKKVTLDLIIVAIANYLIIGILAGSICYLAYVANPDGAFRIPEHVYPVELLDMVYFAFVTLATLGYGDIIPGNQQTMTLSTLIAITGQFYVAILVAFLVSKFVIHSESDN